MSALDKATRLAAERAAAAAARRKKTARLDPKFPYRIVAFDAMLFGVTADPGNKASRA